MNHSRGCLSSFFRRRTLQVEVCFFIRDPLPFLCALPSHPYPLPSGIFISTLFRDYHLFFHLLGRREHDFWYCSLLNFAPA